LFSELNDTMIKKIIFILSLGVLFTAAFTWPFVSKIASYYSDSGDYPLTGWMLWYNFQHLKNLSIFSAGQYFNASQFSLLPNSLTYSEHLFIPSLFFSPLFALTKNLVLSVNVFSFSTFVLSFVTSFYLIYYFTKSRKSSVVGALIYTFNPLTFSHFPDHLHLVCKFFLPLVFLFAYRFLEKPKLKSSFLFFLFFTLNALSVINFGIISAISLLIFVVPFLAVAVINKNYNYLMNLLKYSLVALIFSPMLLYFYLPYYQTSRSEGLARTLEENVAYSARLNDWIAPTPENIFYKKLFLSLEKIRAPREQGGSFNYSEHTLFLNVLPFLLFLVGLYTFYMSYLKKRYSLPVFLSTLFLLLSAFILTFGPFFLGWDKLSGNIKLPFYYIYKIFPLMDGIRTPTRFQFIFYIPFSIIAALGVSQILKKISSIFRASKLRLLAKSTLNYLLFPKKPSQKTIVRWVIYLKEVGLTLIVIVFILVLFAENYLKRDYLNTSTILSNVESSKLEFLKDKLTIHYPSHLDRNFPDEAGYLNWATVTKEKLVNGYSGYYPPDFYYFMLDFNKSNLSDTSIKKLKSLGVEYLVIHEELLSSKENEFVKNNLKSTESATVLKQENESIINLEQINPPVTVCNTKDSLGFSFVSPLIIQFGKPIFSIARLENRNSCFYVTPKEQRYLKVHYRVGKREGDSFLILPILIEPQRASAVSTLLLRCRSKFLCPGPGSYQETLALDGVNKNFKINLNILKQN